MKLTARIPVTAGLMALSLLSVTGCARLRAADQLNKGVAAFKNAKYEEATNHFQQAVSIDPNYNMAKLYLATTYSSQVVPNLNTPENLAMAHKAIDGFNEVLSRDPNDLTALRQIASLDRSIGKNDESKQVELKVISADPNDSEAYYAIGQSDWKKAFDNAEAVRKSQGLTTDDNAGNVKMSKDNCAKLTAENTPIITEGIQYLTKSVDINKSYEEPMTILSLIYRRKADTECGNDAARQSDIATASQWEARSMSARKANEKAKEDKSHGVAM